MQSSQLQHFSSKQNTAKLNPFNAGSHKREGSRRAEEGKVPEDIYKARKISEHTSPCGSVCSTAGKSSGGFVCFFLFFFALLISAPARVVALTCVVQKHNFLRVHQVPRLSDFQLVRLPHTPCSVSTVYEGLSTFTLVTVAMKHLWNSLSGSVGWLSQSSFLLKCFLNPCGPVALCSLK